MIPPELASEVEALRQLGYTVDIAEAGLRVYVILRDVALPATYKPQRTDLMVFTASLYPNAGFDMFWTNPDVLLVDGRIPQAAEAIEEYEGRKWRRFSWHLNRPWNPNHDNLRSWLAYCEDRLMRGV